MRHCLINNFLLKPSAIQHGGKKSIIFLGSGILILSIAFSLMATFPGLAMMGHGDSMVGLDGLSLRPYNAGYGDET